MAKVSSVPAIPFLSKHNPAEEEDEEEDEEEYDMASHSTEDRVRPSLRLGLMSYNPRPTC